jgi:beta-lactamase class A
MKDITNFSKPKLLVIILITLAIGCGVGVLLEQTRAVVQNKPMIEELRQSAFKKINFHFIDPLLGCSISTQKNTIGLDSLKDQINALITDRLAQNKASMVSVYFDTRDGNWFSLNQNEKYYPASLMKVPTGIAFLKEAETKPEVLAKKIVYDGSFDYNKIEYFKPPQVLTAGQSYTVDDLISRMVGYSDNNAYWLLSNNIDSKLVNQVHNDLGAVDPNSDTGTVDDFITVSQYANFFRVLYNATYLNRKMSEKLLTYLNINDFPQGLTSGIPQNVAIAQKFGESSVSSNGLYDPNAPKQLHDCGIIYYPNHPYLLCVMTKGTDFNALSGVISEISKTSYTFIDAQAKGK